MCGSVECNTTYFKNEAKSYKFNNNSNKIHVIVVGCVKLIIKKYLPESIDVPR